MTRLTCTSRTLAGRCAVTLAVLVWLGLGVTRLSAVQQLCSPGTYGPYCHACQCPGNGPCAAQTGVCLENIALKQPVTMSSTLTYGSNKWIGANAVDGYNGSNWNKPDTCDCCSSTDLEPNPWLEVDLGSNYAVSEIVIAGPNESYTGDYTKDLKGLKVYLEQHTVNMATQSLTPVEYSGNQFRLDLTNHPPFRYITLLLPGGTTDGRYLTVCEIQAIQGCSPGTYGSHCLVCQCPGNGPCEVQTGECLENIALKQPVRMSSTLTYKNKTWVRTRAVDGYNGSDWNNPNACDCCSSTNLEPTPWLEVDLGSNYAMSHIVIAGRNDDQSGDYTKDLKGLKVYLEQHTVNMATQSLTPVEYSGNQFRLDLTNHPPFRYITLLLPGGTTDGRYLTVCEIQAIQGCSPGTYGPHCLVCQCPGNGPCEVQTGECLENIALKQPVRMSSTLTYKNKTWVRTRAVDGYNGSDWNNPNACDCCSSTNLEPTPWLEVDLGSNYAMSHIVIAGRNDDQSGDYAKNLKGLKVYLEQHTVNMATQSLTPVEYSGNQLRLDLTNHPPFRYITLLLSGGTTDGRYLTVCEIQAIQGCSPGTYGPHCQVCQCPGNGPCEVQTGECLENIALKQPVRMSSTLTYKQKTWVRTRAVDGYNGSDWNNPNACDCCSSTDLEPIPWLEVDLGSNYDMSHIVIAGRNDDQSGDYAKNLKGLKVYLEQHTVNMATQSLTPVEYSGNQFRLDLTNHPPFQYITLLLPGGTTDGRYLTVCEIQAIQRCSPGTYGPHCLVCLCPGNGPCEVQTGECLENIALKQPVRMSSTLTYKKKSWVRTRAVDGYNGSDWNNPNACDCCSSTDLEPIPWLEVDLGSNYAMSHIVIAGRNDDQSGDYTKNLKGLKVYLEQHTVNMATQSLTPVEYSGNQFRLDLTNHPPFRYITLLLPGGTTDGRYLTVCEIQAIQGCSPGTYGPHCLVCQCPGNGPCEVKTGECLENIALNQPVRMSSTLTYKNKTWVRTRAVDGYNGSDWNNPNACDCCSSTDLEPTPWLEVDLGSNYAVSQIVIAGRNDGHSGDYAKNLKGLKVYLEQHTVNMATQSLTPVEYSGNQFRLDLTNHPPFRYITLLLPGGTTDGRYLTVCEIQAIQGCPDYRYGNTCVDECHCLSSSCNQLTGICPFKECQPGWSGPQCSTPCTAGLYGNCTQQCGNCINNNPCSFTDGHCTGCIGYKPPLCQSECGDGTFGLDCNGTCHCSRLGGTCNKVSGKCPGGCEAGYYGDTCENEPLESDDGTPAGAIGGAVGGVLVLVAAAVVAILILKRRRRKAGYKDAPTPMYDEIAETNVDTSQKLRIHSSKQGPKAKSKHGQENQVVNVIYEIPDITYYEFAEIDDTIKLYHLYDYIHKEKQNKWESLYAEFNTLKGGLGYGYQISQREENIGKSRYREMCAYDHSRVHLEVNEPGETDYINACHIDGYEKVKKFIASQGPTQNMVEDFWRMVLQQKAEIIVILVNVIEMGQKNCMQYWPDKTAIQFGRITIKQIKSLNYPDFSIRTLEVEQKQKEGHRVTQLHFKAWPDKGVPDNARSLVNFWRVVSKTVASTTAPVIVHCSAGVGPTGTFIALDNLYTMARTEGVVRPLSVVEGLRRQRVNMVQTKEQYVYLHEVVAEALCVGTQSVPTSQFEETYRFMKEELDSETHMPMLAMQYDLIQKSLAQSHNSEVDSEPGYFNVTAEIDAERRELVLGPVATGQTIGAVYLPNHRGSSICITAQSPSKATLEEFWTLIAQNNIKTVVMLTSQSDESYSLSHNLGTKDTTNIGPYVVNILNERQFSCFQEVCFTFRKREQRNDVLRTVKQFVLLGWRDRDVVPVDPQPVLDMLDAVERWQPHVSDGQPVLVHCRTGAERSGLWCLLMCERQRMKLDRTVHILGTVKNIKTRNSKLIPNYEQYKFCHDVILMNVADAGGYQNI